MDKNHKALCDCCHAYRNLLTTIVPEPGLSTIRKIQEQQDGLSPCCWTNLEEISDFIILSCIQTRVGK